MKAAGVAAASAQKDLGYYTAMATDSGAASTIAQGVCDTFAQAVAQGDGQALVPELVAQLTRQGDGVLREY